MSRQVITDRDEDVLGMIPKPKNGRAYGRGEEHELTGDVNVTAQTLTVGCITHDWKNKKNSYELFHRAHPWDNDEEIFSFKVRPDAGVSLFDEANRGCAFCVRRSSRLSDDLGFC